MDPYAQPDQPTLKDQVGRFPPPTPAQKQAGEVILGIGIGFFVWAALGAPGAPFPEEG